MPARSLQAAPDAQLKAEIKDLKARVSSLDNALNASQKALGAAQKDQKRLASLEGENAALKQQLITSQAEVARLHADVNSARSKGSADAEILAAARQVAEGIKKLG